MYQNGEGVPEDDVEAVRLFRLAADQGDPDAQNNLGMAYWYGEGTIMSWVTAYAWLNIAVAYGNEDAARNRSSIERRAMTPDLIAEAQQLSTEIFERIQQGN